VIAASSGMRWSIGEATSSSRSKRLSCRMKRKVTEKQESAEHSVTLLLVSSSGPILNTNWSYLSSSRS
jgi:hypothetical protein